MRPAVPVSAFALALPHIRTCTPSACRVAMTRYLRLLPLALALYVAVALLSHGAPSLLSPVRAASASPPPPRAVVAFASAPSREVARALANGLVRGKLAACVQSIPGVESTYMWEGRVETAEEVVLVIKTRAELVDEVAAYVQREHPYDVPEMVAVAVEGGIKPYLKWVAEVTKGKGE